MGLPRHPRSCPVRPRIEAVPGGWQSALRAGPFSMPVSGSYELSSRHHPAGHRRRRARPPPPRRRVAGRTHIPGHGPDLETPAQRNQLCPRAAFCGGIQRLLKNSERQVPRRLKRAGDANNKGVIPRSQGCAPGKNIERSFLSSLFSRLGEGSFARELGESLQK